MTTVEEIEHAIRALSPEERTRLANSLPWLIREVDGDVSWERIASDPVKRPSLSASLDELDAEFGRDPDQFRRMEAGDFEQAK